MFEKNNVSFTFFRFELRQLWSRYRKEKINNRLAQLHLTFVRKIFQKRQYTRNKPLMIAELILFFYVQHNLASGELLLVEINRDRCKNVLLQFINEENLLKSSYKNSHFQAKENRCLYFSIYLFFFCAKSPISSLYWF